MASGTVWAAFDLPAAPPERGRRLRGRFTTAPTVLRAAGPAEVPAVVGAAERAALAGNWVVGGLSYGAAGAWDAAQSALRDETPAAHFEVYSGPPEPWPEAAGTLPALDWRPDPELAGGRQPQVAIAEARERIAAGDCYQVNLTSKWRAVAPPAFDRFAWFAALAAAQPGGYAVYSRTAGVASVSPELFFHAAPGGRLTTQPMKGTAPAETPGTELVASQKDRAENLMIVDLLRNDLGRICLPGTVTVERLFELHRLPTVWQLTSTVTGQARPGTTLADVFAALFPCGSVTGAPKLAAMAVAAELEAGARGWYCGALGVIRPGGEATFNVPIRTVGFDAAGLTCGIGSGIVADSEAAAEVAEWRSKARFLGGVPLRALETMLLSDGRIPRLTAHLARLASGCADLGLAVDPAAVAAAVAEAVAANPTGRHRLRLVAGDGPAEVSVSPAPPEGEVMVLQLAAEPLDVARFAPVIRNKTTHRAHYQRLVDLAPAHVSDVICHAGGELTECSRGNLAVRLDGQWCTPPVEVGLLPGTLRGELIASGRLSERRLGVRDLPRAEGVAFLNSLRGWCPAILA